jgi:hypothetical protein
MKILLPFVFIFVFISNLNAQQKLYLQADAGAKLLLPQYVSQRILSNPNQLKPLYGFKAGYQLTKIMSIETGIYYNKFTNKYQSTYDGQISTGTLTDYSSGVAFISVPLHLKLQQRFWENKAAINVFFGPELYFSREDGEYKKALISSESDGIVVNGTETASRDRIGTPIFSGGLGLDYRINSNLWFVSSFTASVGSKTMNTFTVDWEQTSTSTKTDYLTTKWKGDSFDLKFGFKYYFGK